MRTYEDISKDYQIDSNGIVQSPGKFESEHWSTIDLYESVMNGFSDETLFFGDTPYDVFLMSDEDRAKYDIDKNTYAIVLHESESGFMYGESMTEREYNEFMKAHEQQENEDESDYE